MPVLVSKDSGLAENLNEDAANQAIQAGTHEVPIVDPSGQHGSAPWSDTGDLLKQGYRQPSPEELQSLLQYSKRASPLETTKAALEGAASAATFGISTFDETALGVDPQAIRERRQVLEQEHPALAIGSQLAGLAGTAAVGVGEGAALAKLGSLVPQFGTGFAAKVGTAAARAGLENMAFQTGDEVSRMFAQDPNQTAETAAANVGLSGLLGAGIGAGLGSAPASWDALMEGKAGKFVSDLKARASERLNNPDPVGNFVAEQGNIYQNAKDMSSEVYGKSGLKAQEIAKVMPEMSEAIREEPIKVQSKVQESIDKMREQPFKYGGERYPGLLDEALNEFKVATQDVRSPGQLFDAMNNLKQRMNRYIPSYVTPDNPAFDAVNEFKSLAKDIRTGLENKDVWGAAGERQAAINKGFAEYLPSLEDYEKKFTTEVNGQRVIDPGKINTYINQLGKPNAEIKQDILRNFLNATEKYRGVIDDTHANLGIENPYSPPATVLSRASLQEITPGAKVADMLIDKGIGHMVGGAIGGGVGALAGHPGWGALVGQHVLGPVADKIIPQLIKPILEGPVSGGGMRAALQYGTAVVRGDSTLSRVTKAALKGGRMELSEPTEKEREKLKKRVDESVSNQDSMLEMGGKLGHYLPSHGSAVAATANRAVQYLAALRPHTEPVGPLDLPKTPSATEEGNYNQALNIAENPLLVMKYVKEGSLSQQDVTHCNAMYPSLLQSMRSKVMDQIVEHKANGGMLPYKTKIALSILMAQPLDSSMQPAAIAANQPIPQQGMPQAPAPRRKHSMNQLAKLSSSYKTPEQARESSRSEST